MSLTLEKFEVKIQLQQPFEAWQTHVTSWSVQQDFHQTSGCWELDTDYLRALRILTMTQQ